MRYSQKKKDTNRGAKPKLSTKTKRYITRAAIFFIWLFIWQVLASLIHKPLLFAGPYETFQAFFRLIQTTNFYAVLAYTTFQIMGGFFLAFFCALLAGMLAAKRPFLRLFLQPLMSLLKSIPIVCFIVVLLLWLNSADVPFFAVTLVVLPAYYFSFLEGASLLTDPSSLQGVPSSKQAPPKPDNPAAKTNAVLRLLGVSVCRRALSQGWLSVYPYLEATSASVVGMAWKAGVAAQLIGLARFTVGERIYQAKVLIDAPNLFAWSFALVLCAYLCEKLIHVLLRRSCPALSWLALHLPHIQKFETRSRSTAKAKKPTIEVCKLSAFCGGRSLFENLSFALPPNVHIIGASGTGKSTLCLMVCGLLHPEKGRISAPSRIGVMLQTSTLIGALSVEENLLLCDRAALKTSLVALAHLAPDINVHQSAATLSGGQAKKVELVRALFSKGDALVLDEPFAGLDEQSEKRAIALIEERQNAHMRPLLLVTHGKGTLSGLKLKTLQL